MPEYTNDGTLDYTSDYQAAGDSYTPPPPEPLTFDSFDAGMAVLGAMSGSGVAAGGEGQADIYGSPAPGAGLMAESGSVASTLGANWLSDGFNKALGWFNEQKPGTQGAMVTLAGSFLKGLFSSEKADRRAKLKIDQQNADASTLRASTEAQLAQQKMANASSIGQTNFGAKPAGGLMFSNKLAGRQTRAGYGG